MGLFDSILGGGGDSGGSIGPIQKFSNLTSNQLRLTDRLAGAATGLIPSAVRRAKTPLGIAGISPLQQQAFGGFGGLEGLGISGLDIAGQGLQGFDPSLGGQFLGQAGGALQQGLQGFDPQRILDALEPGRQSALNTFNENIIPSILTSLGATSGESGPLNVALANAGKDLPLGLNAQAAPFLGQAALSAPGLQFQGAGLAGNLAQLPGQLAGQSLGIGAQGSDLLGQLLNVGGVQRGIAQEPLSALFQANQAPLSILSQLSGQSLGGQPAFSSFAQQQQPGASQSLLPALGAFAGSKSGSERIGNLLGNIPFVGGLFG